MISKESLKKDILQLGVQPGDNLYIAANLYEVGFFHLNLRETYRIWVDLLLETVGPTGTIIVPAYTNTFIRFKKDKKIIFERYTKPVTGSLSLAFFYDPRSIRSSHPTNSYLGIGQNAYAILNDHDHTKLSYYPIGKIIELNGKILMLGTVDKINAPGVLHSAQEYLGHTKHNPYNGLFQSYYIDEDGSVRLFTKYDNGGCSRGGYNLYGSLIVNDTVRFGMIGNAKSSLLDAKKSFDVVVDILKRNARIIQCDDKMCTSCYGRWSYNGLSTIWFYLNKFIFNKLAGKRY